MKTSPRPLPLVALALVAGVAGVAAAVLTGGDGAPEAGDDGAALQAVQADLESSLVLPADFRTVPDFSLVGTDGGALDQGFLDGAWTLAFFGYTHCPDVCPITLQVVKEAVAGLEAVEAEPLQVAFFTVDPARDTAKRMAEYVGFFDEDFVGVTGDMADVHALTSSLGIVAAFTANEDDPDAYLVDHTASMLLIDPERRVRAKLNPPHDADTIVADYLTLMAALN